MGFELSDNQKTKILSMATEAISALTKDGGHASTYEVGRSTVLMSEIGDVQLVVQAIPSGLSAKRIAEAADGSAKGEGESRTEGVGGSTAGPDE